MGARIRFREPDTAQSTGGDINVNIVQVGGTTQSPSDWSAHFAFLDGAATEATLALVKAKTNNLDVALSTRASEATLAGANTRLGEVQADPTANTLLDRMKAIRTQLNVLLSTRASEASLTTRLADSSFTSRVGEVGAAPAANTLLGRVKDVQDKLGDAATENTVIKELVDAQALLASIESRVGAIDPAPTANTLQDRLKGLKTRVDLLATEATLAGELKRRTRDETAAWLHHATGTASVTVGNWVTLASITVPMGKKLRLIMAEGDFSELASLSNSRGIRILQGATVRAVALSGADSRNPGIEGLVLENTSGAAEAWEIQGRHTDAVNAKNMIGWFSWVEVSD